jgi:hypothetical protein
LPSGIGIGGCIIGTLSQQPTLHGVLQPILQGLQHFGLQKAKKCARLLVQHEPHDDFASQPQVGAGVEQLGQLEWQLIEWQPRLQGSRQSSDRRPRWSFSSRHGLGQQRPIEGGGTGVQQVGAAQVGTASWQPHPLLCWNRPKPTGLITERVAGCGCE